MDLRQSKHLVFMYCTSLLHCCFVDYIENKMSKLQVNQLNQLREIFAKFDMDSDGSLTILELAALLRLVDAILHDISAEILLKQEMLFGVFKCFDRDGNGYITAAELAGAMAKMGQPVTYRELTEMITEADTDGDGVISFNEFVTVMGRSATHFLGLALL